MADKPITFRRITSEDQRLRGGGRSSFISLSDESPRFVGYALFNADPKDLKDRGYIEYAEHWNHAAKMSIPCMGDDCPLCEEGDRPKMRAMSLWLVSELDGEELKEPEVKVWRMNTFAIDDFTVAREEGEPIRGQLYRITRLDDKGRHQIRPRASDLLPAKQVEAAIDSGPDLEQMIMGSLKRYLEAANVKRVLGDDNGEPEPVTRARAGTAATSAPDLEEEQQAPPAPEPEEEPVEPEPEPQTEEEQGAANPPAEVPEQQPQPVIILELDAPANTMIVKGEGGWQKTVWGTDQIDVADHAEGERVLVAWFTDEEGDLVLTSCQAAPGPKQGAYKLPDVDDIESLVCVVSEVDELLEMLVIEHDELGLRFPLYFAPYVDAVFSSYKPGQKVIVTAAKGDDGEHMMATIAPQRLSKTSAKGR